MSNPHPSNPIKKGETRNPNGRPKKEWSLTESMREFMSTVDPETKKLRKDMFIESQLKHALKGDPTAAKHLWNYLDGMPVQKNEHTGKDGGPLQVEKVTFTVEQPNPTE